MHARKITVSSLALVFGLGLAGLAGAADSPKASPDAAEKCCQHKDKAEGAAHCDHRANAKSGQSSDGKACCTQHAANKQDGGKGEGCCCCDSCENGGKKAAPQS